VAATLTVGMALALFALGLAALAAGLWTILAREYQQALKGISAQSSRLQARSLVEIGVVPVMDATTRLIQAVNALIRTAMGVGAFLCLIGLALCLIGWWMLTTPL
jgi:hypothetical protein